MTLTLSLIGCGVMGRRHVLGLKALKDAGREPFHLTAVCDPVPESATAAADLAEELLGRRPDVFPDLATLYGSTSVDAVDITTAPNFHLAVGEVALAHGAHVMVEKPITLTIAQGRALVAAADNAGQRLAVAENYRRDPINRLAKASDRRGFDRAAHSDHPVVVRRRREGHHHPLAPPKEVGRHRRRYGCSLHRSL